MPEQPHQDKDTITEEKVKKVLKAAGVVIPDDPNLREKLSAELSKQGHPQPYYCLLACGNYCLVLRD